MKKRTKMLSVAQAAILISVSLPLSASPDSKYTPEVWDVREKVEKEQLVKEEELAKNNSNLKTSGRGNSWWLYYFLFSSRNNSPLGNSGGNYQNSNFKRFSGAQSPGSFSSSYYSKINSGQAKALSVGSKSAPSRSVIRGGFGGSRSFSVGS